MVENAFGTFSLPLGVATNFRINGRDYLVPMVIEEPSVIAAASKAAKLARPGGGFAVSADESYSIGQIQVSGRGYGFGHIPDRRKVPGDPDACKLQEQHAGQDGQGGQRRYPARGLDTDNEVMLIVELLVDVGDAMGANVTNTMCETVAPLIEEVTGGRALLRILSNYSTRRMVKATAVFDAEAVGGQEVVENMVRAYQFAKHDVYRAVTHNKGIMNGVIAVANATGQDSRAIEAAANAYASRSGQYRSLSEWDKDAKGNLVGDTRDSAVCRDRRRDNQRSIR